MHVKNPQMGGYTLVFLRIGEGGGDCTRHDWPVDIKITIHLLLLLLLFIFIILVLMIFLFGEVTETTLGKFKDMNKKKSLHMGQNMICFLRYLRGD